MSASGENIGRIANNHIETALLVSIFELVLKIKALCSRKSGPKYFSNFSASPETRELPEVKLCWKRWQFCFLRQNFQQKD